MQLQEATLSRLASRNGCISCHNSAAETLQGFLESVSETDCLVSFTLTILDTCQSRLEWTVVSKQNTCVNILLIQKSTTAERSLPHATHVP